MPEKSSSTAKEDNGGIIALRPYQEEILRKIIEAYGSKSKLLISLATGFGRQITIANSLNKLFENHKISRALIVIPRCEIRDQFVYSLNKYSSGYACIIKLDKKTESILNQKKSEPQIVVSTLAMFRKIKNPSQGQFDIIILDDCHQFSERDWFIANSLDSAIIGFTPLHPLEMSPKLFHVSGK